MMISKQKWLEMKNNMNQLFASRYIRGDYKPKDIYKFKLKIRALQAIIAMLLVVVAFSYYMSCF